MSKHDEQLHSLADILVDIRCAFRDAATKDSDEAFKLISYAFRCLTDADNAVRKLLKGEA